MIISASRRTDIPAFYSEWFMNRLKEGYVLTRNPMNHSQVSKIILSPDVVDCIVFWTKDPKNILDKLPVIDNLGYQYYFQFTLTPYNQEIESFLRKKEEIIDTFIKLSEKKGKNKVLWRYDPIILNKDLTIEFHLEHFQYLCSKLSGFTGICNISFVDIYSKLGKAVKNNLLREITIEEMIKLASGFAKIGKSYGIELRACCERVDLSAYGVRQASCIDKAIIEEINGCSLEVKADTNQRAGCGCIQSTDIGAYNTCQNGCIYCYANYSYPAVANNCLKHNPRADILIGEISQEDKIIEKNMCSCKKIDIM
ncbi:DUF1848 domain-containing protein [Anaerocolumna sp. MB42-C2]|uniref:DUF1848 domain-containing protein n=1 Tax=Anaerocolumna sp. MB42-C2 TaxID=3070997 RepID=UPI0027DFC7A4|nr:DUF1848 domain-containing protein [Anaerocolumna sp. MB42-C2]WMJ87355.1 DUF1848 domain-containing protein [Anaerocolumna sp. MB42-C2]